MKKVKFICLLAALLTALSSVCVAKTVSSEGDVSNPDEPIAETKADMTVGADLKIKAKSAILMEPYSKTVLYEQNSNQICAPASITKIMSLLLIMEAIEQKKITTEEVITASLNASKMGGSQIWLKENESMTLDDLLKAIVIGSANDATVAVAEHIAGSEEEFVRQMNNRAKEIGMEHTVFKNSTGLDEKGHITTCFDVAVMSSELIKYPLIKKYSTVWMDSLRNGESELVNTNKLVRFYSGTTGLKTGTTSKAGCCLSASAKREDTEFIAVVMGAENSNERFSGAKKLLDFGFSNYLVKEVSCVEPSKKIITFVKNGTKKTVYGDASGSVKILLRKSEADSIVQKINFEKEICAPVKKNDIIGTVDLYIDKELVGKIEIKAKESIEKIKFGVTFLWILKGLVKL